MRKSIFFAVISVLSLFVLSISSVHAAGPVDACTVFTKADAEALFNVKVTSQKAAKVSAPAGNMCTYYSRAKGDTYSVKLRISSSEEIKAEGIFLSARDVFDRQKKARMANSSTSKKTRNIPALGDEAFWNGNDLWVVKANYLLVVLAHPYLPGNYGSRDAMDKAREQQDFQYSQRMAMTVLLKMK